MQRMELGGPASEWHLYAGDEHAPCALSEAKLVAVHDKVRVWLREEVAPICVVTDVIRTLQAATLHADVLSHACVFGPLWWRSTIYSTSKYTT